MRKQLLTLVGAAILSSTSFAQTQYVHQVIYLNEGQFDYTNQTQVTPVSLGSYDVVTESYTEFVVINNARFGSDVLVDGNYIYVAADSLLLQYDKNTLSLVNSATVKGIRKIAVWNDHILITIGESGIAHDAYFQVYDKDALGFQYELGTGSGPMYSTEGVAVINDTAYLGVNNALLDWMNPKGLIGIVDLTNEMYKGEVDIDPNGKNPDNLMVSNNKLYTLNNTDFTNSSVTEFDPIDRSFTTTSLNAPSGCGASVFADNNVYYHRYDNNSDWVDTNATLNLFKVADQSITTVYPNLMNVYGMADDVLNSQIYLTTTDFFSYGKAYIMDYTGLLTDSFDVGISAGNIALDVRDLVSIDEEVENTGFNIHPNPSSSIVYIEADNVTDSYELLITDITGRQVYSELVNQVISKSIDMTGWANGVYMISITSDQGKFVNKVVKN